jgi:hypothetical protein
MCFPIDILHHVVTQSENSIWKESVLQQTCSTAEKIACYVISYGNDSITLG